MAGIVIEDPHLKTNAELSPYVQPVMAPSVIEHNSANKRTNII